MIIDTHAHLNDEIYSDLSRIIAEMPNDNLEKIVCASASTNGSKKSLELAKNNQNLYAMLGVHPDNSFEYDEDFVRSGIQPSPILMPTRVGRIYSFGELNQETFKGLQMFRTRSNMR